MRLSKKRLGFKRNGRIPKVVIDYANNCKLVSTKLPFGIYNVGTIFIVGENDFDDLIKKGMIKKEKFKKYRGIDITIYNSCNINTGIDSINYDSLPLASVKKIKKEFRKINKIDYKIIRFYKKFQGTTFVKHIFVPTENLNTTLKYNLCYYYIREFSSAKKDLIIKSKVVKRQFYTAKYEKNGGVHTRPGEILRIQKNANNKTKLNIPKTPVNKTNHIGVEIEFCIPRGNFEDFQQSLVNHKIAKNINIKSDGSLRAQTGELSREAAIIAPEAYIFDVVEKFCKILNQFGGISDETRRCGVHVHLDMRNREVKKCYHNLVFMQDWLRKLLKRSRLDNDFCQPNQSTDYNDRTPRYSGINKGAYNQHKTLEVRYLHGTIDHEEINNWIKFLLKIVDYDAILTKDIDSFETVFKRLNIKQELSNYIRVRSA